MLGAGFVVFSLLTTMKVLPKELEGSTDAEVEAADPIDRADDEAALPHGGSDRD